MNNKDVEYLRKYLEQDKFEDGIEKLKKGIPVQYIVGNVDFYGNIIEINDNVLIPRFETELLVEKTIKYCKDMFNNNFSNIKILDIGTGSGCIAISLKKKLASYVLGIDISEDALDVAKINAKNNNVDVEFIYSDVFSNVNGKFDVIISNPPYIREDETIEDIVKNNEPNIALYAEDNGLYYYKKIIGSINNYLCDNFIVAFEIGMKQAGGLPLLLFILKHTDIRYFKISIVFGDIEYNGV